MKKNNVQLASLVLVSDFENHVPTMPKFKVYGMANDFFSMEHIEALLPENEVVELRNKFPFYICVNVANVSVSNETSKEIEMVAWLLNLSKGERKDIINNAHEMKESIVDHLETLLYYDMLDNQ